ncbi:MAG: hypothetical protein PWP48_1333 [Clostridiales bacterium]|jgi:glycosyltransferase involved in cell wall biosynthesis|nr:hypothetical protein [Clostridiales bacterium]
MSGREKVFIFSCVHKWDDVRVYHKQAMSLARFYDVQVHAIADFEYRKVNGVEIYGLPNYGKRYKRPLLWWALLKRAIKARADIYHFHDPELIPTGLLVGWITGKPVIYDIHEDYPRAILTKSWIPKYIRKPVAYAFDGFQKLCGKGFAQIIVVTEELQRSFKSDKVTLVQNFPLLSMRDDVESLIERRRQNGQHVKLVYAGGLTDIRGIYEMVKAFDYIPKDMDVNMILAGSFNDERYEKKVLDYIAGEKRITYIGQVSYNDAYQLMCESDIGLICFKPVGHNTHSLSNKMFEYMSVGIPVIASDFPLWRGIIETNDCGIMIDPLDSRQIAQAITYLAQNPDKRAQMGMNGYKAYKDKYNWAAEERKLLDVYERILNR